MFHCHYSMFQLKLFQFQKHDNFQLCFRWLYIVMCSMRKFWILIANLLSITFCRLASGINNARIVDQFFDKSNWCIILEKILWPRKKPSWSVRDTDNYVMPNAVASENVSAGYWYINGLCWENVEEKQNLNKGQHLLVFHSNFEDVSFLPLWWRDLNVHCLAENYVFAT